MALNLGRCVKFVLEQENERSGARLKGSEDDKSIFQQSGETQASFSSHWMDRNSTRTGLDHTIAFMDFSWRMFEAVVSKRVSGKEKEREWNMVTKLHLLWSAEVAEWGQEQ